jgi:hypothetical protein
VSFGMFDTRLDRQGARLFGGGDSEMIRRLRAVGLEIWFVPGAKVLHQMPAQRLTLGYSLRHAFDSARSRVLDQVRVLKGSDRIAAGYLLTRAVANVFKVFGFLVLALLSVIVFRTGSSKRALVRSWRSCGYLYQILRSSMGRI